MEVGSWTTVDCELPRGKRKGGIAERLAERLTARHPQLVLILLKHLCDDLAL